MLTKNQALAGLLAALMVVGVVLVALGLSNYSDYSGSQVLSTQIRSGTVLAFSYNTSVVENLAFHLVVDIPNRYLTVIWDWSRMVQGDYGFVVLLPVTLTGPQNGTQGWYYHNVEGNGSWVEVRIHDTPQNLTSEIWGEFATNDPLVSGDHGNFNFYLPMGEDIPKGLSNSINSLNANIPNPKFPYQSFAGPVTVVVGTPQNEPPSYIYPPTAVPTSSHYQLGPLEQSYYWSFPTFQAVILNYQDSSLVQHYQNDLFFSGLFLGVGIPLLLGTSLEIARSAPRKPSGTVSREGATQVSHPLHFGYYMAGGVVAIVLILMLLWEASWANKNPWWFSIITVIAFLITDGTDAAFKKGTARISDEFWIPIRFALFILVVLILGPSEEAMTDFVKFGLFGTSLSAGSATFIGLNMGLPIVLYYDFIRRGGFRRVRHLDPVLGSDEETWNRYGE